MKMKAKDILTHFKSKGSWVDWERTVDQFLFGDPEIEISGIAVSWMPTKSNLEEALDKECNVFITHEPLFAAKINDDGIIVDSPIINDPHSRWVTGLRKLEKEDIWVKKMEWLEQHKLTILRCHDFWDNYPELGVHGAWARWLGYTRPPLTIEGYYELHEIPETTLEKLARDILEKIKPLGQDSLQIIGDLSKNVKKITIGTGAATHYREMNALGGDAILISDDGTYFWESGQWALESGIPLIIVNHSLSEEPGMRTLAEYLKKNFSGIQVDHIPVGCIFKSIF
jgi:putative NIF3 family GTP cyclohydrolase 1 type 2